jgi:hypothetical protein
MRAELSEKRTPSSRGSVGRSDGEVITGNIVQTRRRWQRVVSCEEEPGRRSAAHLLTRDEPRRIQRISLNCLPTEAK